uniref:Pentraxin family member n=1 Tax=Amphilophus citrinellus TaxID=61819 RepID=A0A3Q0S644_AMPCI
NTNVCFCFSIDVIQTQLYCFRSAVMQNYVTFSPTLPDLPELSVCLWLRVEATHIGTLLSYATDDNDNQLVLYGHRSLSSSVSALLDARWHHLCVVWSSIDGRFWHYNNHLLASSGSDFRKGWEIPGGGAVVLGQEQDSVGGGFDPAEGFAGQLAGFRLWNRVLSPSEVEGVAAGRGVPRGVVLGMEDIQEVHGEVHHVACDCLEYCV